MEEVSKHLKSLYKHTRYTSDESAWPPDQPKHFTNLVVIQCKDKHTTHEVITMTEALTSGGTDSFFPSKDISKRSFGKDTQKRTRLSKDITELFNESDDDGSTATIVIEGAPGIGKTALSKEVAFQWAKGILVLEKVLVFLLF